VHGCGGRGSRESEDAIGSRFTALGYALLIVDNSEAAGRAARAETVTALRSAFGG